MKENNIEEDIKIALDKFSDNKDIDSAILIVEKFILGNYILRGGRKNIVKDSLRYILSDYKRVLKENEELKEDRDKFKKALGKRITYCNELEKDLFENSSNYVIKKQKVKEKIEELNKLIIETQKELGSASKEYTIYVYQENILQDLLREE